MNPSRTTNSAMHSARVQTELEMRESLEKTNQDKINARPENTKKAYEPKIAEFKRWCDVRFAHQPVEERYIVTGEKAHYFLDKEVRNCVLFFS